MLRTCIATGSRITLAPEPGEDTLFVQFRFHDTHRDVYKEWYQEAQRYMDGKQDVETALPID